MQSKDSKILIKLKEGDIKAYKEIFELYYKPLCMLSLRYSDCYDLSEDIVQEFFVKFWNQKLYMKLDGAIGPYLYTSIKNNTLQAIKKENRFCFEEIEQQVDSLIAIEDFDIANYEIEKDKISLAVESLPVKCKAVFKAIALENCKYKEVAKDLNISVNTVKTHYSRALSQLRDSLILLLISFFL